MKKRAKFFLYLFISPLLVVSIALSVFYFIGPQLILIKARDFIKKKYSIFIDFKEAKFVPTDELLITEFHFKKKDFDLSINRIKIKYDLSFKNRFLLIHVFEIIEPRLRLNIQELLSNANTNTPSISDDLKVFEDFILSPPKKYNLKKLKISNLDVFFNKNIEYKKNSFQNKNLEAKALDLEIDFKLTPGNFSLFLSSQLKNKINYSQGTSEKAVKLKVSRFKLNSNISVTKDPAGHWSYQLQPFILDQWIEKMEIFNSTKNKPSPALEIDNLSMNLDIIAIKDSQKLFQLIDFKPKSLIWKLDLKLEKLKSDSIQKYSIKNNHLTNKSGLSLVTDGKLNQFSPSFKTFGLPYTWEFNLDFKSNSVQLKNYKTTLKLSTHWKDNLGDVVIETIPQKLVKFSAKTEVHNQVTQILGKLQAQLPKNLLNDLIKINIDGNFNLPFNLFYEPRIKNNKRKFSLDSKIELDNINYESELLRIKNIQGEIPIFEKIELDSNQLITFQKIIIQNPFKRVDYKRIDPFVRNSAPIKIEQIRWTEKNFGPLFGTLSLDQNLLSLNNISLNLNPGSASGEVFIDFNPETKRVGFLGRVTNTDLSQLIPKGYLAKTNEPMPFSSRIGLTLSLVNKTVDGRIDINQLGSHQLISFINLIDPNYVDEPMNKVRYWLEIGHPNQINLSFNEGSMNMDVDITAFNIKKRQSINGISIQSFIDKAFETKKD